MNSFSGANNVTTEQSEDAKSDYRDIVVESKEGKIEKLRKVNWKIIAGIVLALMICFQEVAVADLVGLFRWDSYFTFFISLVPILGIILVSIEIGKAIKKAVNTKKPTERPLTLEEKNRKMNPEHCAGRFFI